MTSNCYVVYDDDTKRCIAIDPGSEKSLREIEFIEKKALSLDFIFITHEHTDHNWGVNALRTHFTGSKLICSEVCSRHVKKANRAYFLLYYDDPNYRYEIAPADFFAREDQICEWSGYQIKFFFTPGHSFGSICIDIDGMLFTGDTIMPYKPYFNGRDSNQDDWEESIKHILNIFQPNTTICPGHGDILTLGEWANTKY